MAQQSAQDVVYLKNGSIVCGMIIEQVPGKSLKIKTKDGNVFEYEMSKVEKIVKEGAEDKAPKPKKNTKTCSRTIRSKIAENRHSWRYRNGY